jgi:glycosyltransferase involved in cell wall biosynthesis
LNTLRKKAAKNDIVFIATNPAPLLLFIGFLKYFKAFQLHILIHDVFPENTIPAGLFKKNTNIIYRLFALIFNHAYCQADHLITLGRDMEELLLNKIAKKKKDITVSVIPNWGDTKTIMPQNRQDSLITKWGLQDKIILQYAGNIGRVQALPEVIDAFYQNSNTKLHLVIFGSGAYTRNIIQFINKNDVKNITYYGSFLRHEQNEILNSCDIAIVSLSKGMYGLGVPSKAYNILAAGKPILFIGECNSEIAQLVAEEKIGWTIDINKNNALIDFFSNLKLDNPDELLAMGLRARQLCEEKYTKNKILSDLLNSVNNINSK